MFPRSILVLLYYLRLEFTCDIFYLGVRTNTVRISNPTHACHVYHLIPNLLTVPELDVEFHVTWACSEIQHWANKLFLFFQMIFRSWVHNKMLIKFLLPFCQMVSRL